MVDEFCRTAQPAARLRRPVHRNRQGRTLARHAPAAQPVNDLTKADCADWAPPVVPDLSEDVLLGRIPRRPCATADAPRPELTPGRRTSRPPTANWCGSARHTYPGPSAIHPAAGRPTSSYANTFHSSTSSACSWPRSVHPASRDAIDSRRRPRRTGRPQDTRAPSWSPRSPNRLPSTPTLASAGPLPLALPIGLVDNPFAQRRDALIADTRGAGGHVAVVGSPRSGKSIALGTLRYWRSRRRNRRHACRSTDWTSAVRCSPR